LLYCDIGLPLQHTKKEKIMKRNYVMLLLLIWMSTTMFGQVTTSQIKGFVFSKGEALPGATVTVTHIPSGTFNGTITQDNGSFALPNLRVGGPYTVKVSFVGYESVVYKDIYLQLGKVFNLKVEMKEDTKSLDAIVISAERNAVFDAGRTGSETNIGSGEISALPTISRSAEDFYRLDPTSSGNSFAGRNDQFNNFSLDGSIFNNPFGLDAATPGGQSNAQPISLDAIEQIQVAVAPYDVTQSGFTGAAINAVTKSGTNEFHGSVFGYYRDKNMTGKVQLGETTLQPDLSQNQEGFSIGGPIIKNKLFFFLNFERDDRYDLGSYYVAHKEGLEGDNVSRVEAADMDLVSDLLKNELGYETGAYQAYLHRTYSDKGIFKLDWNVFKGTRISFIYNYLRANRELNAHPEAIMHRGPDRTVLQFHNSGYQINNNINSFLVEANSILGNGKMANKLQLGYTLFNDFRNPFSTPAPVINIFKDGQPYIIAGHEPFSIHNVLDQSVMQFTDNLTYYAGQHTITGGIAYEKFDFVNSFNLFGYGFDLFGGFPSVEAFRDSVNSGYVQSRFDAAKAIEEEGKWNITKLSVGQVGLYLQDEWALNNDLQITFGLRVDKPMYFNTPAYIEEKIAEAGDDYIAEDVDWFDKDGNKQKMNPRELPDGKLMFAPRFGFNWDVNGDQSLQVRGGSGIFNGRLPYVWIGNHVANLGRWYYTPIDKDFEFPQIWRTSIGVDKKLPGNCVFSFDAAFSKDLNGMMVRNYGLGNPSGTLNSEIDQRAVYTSEDYAVMPDFGIPTSAYTFTNTNQGYSYYLTFKLQKSFNHGLSGSIAYNYMDSRDANSIEAEITGDAWMRNPALGNVNQVNLAHSLYGDKHRFVGFLTKTWTFGNWGTLLSTYFEMAQGGRFSYTYSGDINGDGSGLNDLIYIPKDDEFAKMQFSGADEAAQNTQREAYKEFVKQDPYLSTHQGEYMERYAILSPWRTHIDLKAAQSYSFSNGKKLEFSLNILNLGNLINSNWGVIHLPTNRQPVGVFVADDGSPVYSFDPTLKNTFSEDYSLLSRWQAQIGLRFVF
jgi:hypothetical protein